MVRTRRSLARSQAATAASPTPDDGISSSAMSSSSTPEHIHQQSNNSTGSVKTLRDRSREQTVGQLHSPSATGSRADPIESNDTQDAPNPTPTLWIDYLQQGQEQSRPTSNLQRQRPAAPSHAVTAESSSAAQICVAHITSPVLASSPSAILSAPATPAARIDASLSKVNSSTLSSPSASSAAPSVLLPSSSPDNALGIDLRLNSSPAQEGYVSYMPRVRLSGRPRRKPLPDLETSQSNAMQVDKVESPERRPDVKLVRNVRKHKSRSKPTSKEVELESSGASVQDDDEVYSKADVEVDYDPKVDASTGKAKRIRSPRGPRKQKVKPAGNPPRPPNAWILYRSAQIQALKADPETLRRPQAEISKLIGYMWRDESNEVKQAYQEQARLKQEEHLRMYPDYTYQPNRKLGPKKQPSSRPGNPRRSTAPAGFNGSDLKAESRRHRAISSESLMSSFRVPHCTSSSASSSVFDFPSGASTPMISHAPYIYHYDNDYTSDLVLDQSVEALLATLDRTALTSTAMDSMPLSAPATFGVDPSWIAFSSANTTETCSEPVFVNDASDMVPWSAPADLTNFNFDHVPVVFGEASYEDYPAGAAAFTPSPMAPSLSSSASSGVTSHSISRQLDYSTLSPDNVGLALCEQQYYEDRPSSSYATSLASPITMLESSPLPVSPAGDLTRLGCSPLMRAHSLSYGPGPAPAQPHATWVPNSARAYHQPQEQDLSVSVEQREEYHQAQYPQQVYQQHDGQWIVMDDAQHSFTIDPRGQAHYTI